ncbi:unnamed protein product [Cylicostephanus goldi]|uniref:Uncharacterized protein n=1 Tax=Cylicostephanus goldi TaxID=71465 RepID=A0A3P6RQN4_CYLGO|nr:unnamed protein product [Cylicostephanus goldi]
MDEKDLPLPDSVVQKPHNVISGSTKAASPKKRSATVIPLTVNLGPDTNTPTKITPLPSKIPQPNPPSKRDTPAATLLVHKPTILPNSPLTKTTSTAQTLTSPRSPTVTTIPLRPLTTAKNRPTVVVLSPQNVSNFVKKSQSNEAGASNLSSISDDAATARLPSPTTARLSSSFQPRSVEEAANAAIAATKLPQKPKDPNEIISATEKALKTSATILPKK